MSKIKVAINTKYNNKEDKNKLSTDWTVAKLTYKELAEHLNKGFPITNIYNKNKFFRRKKDNFTSADFIGLDFDNTGNNIFSLKELKKKETERARFINENACLIYLTFSHTKENNRFRIIFHLPEPILELDQYEETYKAFLNKFPAADKEFIISTGFFWGAKKNTFSTFLDNQLTKEILNQVLKTPEQNIKADNSKIIDNKQKIKPVENEKKESSRKLLPGSERPLDTLISITINKNLEILKKATIGNRDAALNKVCYHLGQMMTGLEWDNNVRLKLKSDIKEAVQKIAYDLGSLDNFQSFTEEKILAIIHRSMAEGEQKPNDYSKVKELQTEIWFLNYHGYQTKNTILTPEAKKKAIADLKEKDKKRYILSIDIRYKILKKHLSRKPRQATRLFPNRKKEGSFQITQSILTDYPTAEIIKNITDQDLAEASEKQIAHFGTFGISSENITKINMSRLLITLQDSEALRHYLALWMYANESNSLDFEKINLNEIIKQMNPGSAIDKKAMYRSRKKFIKYVTLLSSVTLYKTKKTTEKGIYDVAGTHLIGDFEITNEKNHSYLSCKLPEHLGSFGLYIPHNIFKLTGNDKGSFNLAIALLKESFRINGYTKIKLNNYDPSDNKKPIQWENDRLIKEIKTITTPNITKKKELLEKTILKLEEIEIIKYHNTQEKEKTIYLN